MSKKILVVIDIQNDFVTGSLANEETQKILPRVSDLVRDFDGDIIFTRDTHRENYLDTNEGKHLPVKHCIEKTYGQQICRELLGYRDADVVDKYTFGSIKLTNIIKDKILGYGNKVEIHICGTISEICVISNVLLLKAYFPEVKIIVHKDLCTGLDKEGHEAAMLVMKRCHIDIVEDGDLNND